MGDPQSAWFRHACGEHLGVLFSIFRGSSCIAERHLAEGCINLGGTPKWLVYNGKNHEKGSSRGTPIFAEPPIYFLKKLEKHQHSPSPITPVLGRSSSFIPESCFWSTETTTWGMALDSDACEEARHGILACSTCARPWSH